MSEKLSAEEERDLLADIDAILSEESGEPEILPLIEEQKPKTIEELGSLERALDPANFSHCRSCGARIWWGKTEAGKSCPYDVVDGDPTSTSHFASCPDAKRWSKQ